MSDVNQDLVIIQLDRAKQALVEASTIQQTKKIVDVASAAEIYARRQQLSGDAIAYAHSVKFEALRRLGALLKDMPKAKGGQPYQQRSTPTGSASAPVATLASLGITKKQSMLAQQLAGLSQAQFEQVRDGTASMAQVLRAVNKRAPAVDWSIDAFEQRQRVLLHHEIEVAPPGSHRLITDRMRRIADEVDERADPDLFDAAAIAKIDLEIRDAEPGGFKNFDDDGNFIASCKSTHAQWYREVTTATEDASALRRRTVEARVDDIGIGQIPTARTTHSHFAVENAIKDLPRTSPLGRSSYCEGAP